MNRRRSVSPPLARFIQVLFILWFATLLVGWLDKDVLHWPEGYWYPFFLKNARFTDFTIFQERFKHFHERAFFELPGFPFTYPAPVAIVFEGFYLFGAYALDAYICFCVLVFAGAGMLLGSGMYRRGVGMVQTAFFVGSSCILSYPFWFLLDRANIEIVNWLLVALGVAAYWKKRWYLAASFFGVAAAFKIFPFVFLGLLMSARKYRAIVWGVIVGVILTVASTWIIGPTYPVAYAGIARGLEFFRTTYALQVHPAEIGFDHSLFAIVKEMIFRHKAQGTYYLPWLNGYMFVTAAAGGILFFWKIRVLPRANQILALTVASILLPPVSGDYTLVHLYVPWAVLVLVSISAKDVQKVRGLILSFICMAFVMAPESYVSVHGIRIAGQLKAIVLLLLFVVSIVFPFEEPASNSDDERLMGFQLEEATRATTVMKRLP